MNKFDAILLVFLVFYFFPPIVANVQKHRQCMSIGIVNLFFGWTLLGWVIALARAANGNVEAPRAASTADERWKNLRAIPADMEPVKVRTPSEHFNVMVAAGMSREDRGAHSSLPLLRWSSCGPHRYELQVRVQRSVTFG